MKSIFHYVEAIAGSSRPVLITGETGVGKELVARAIHSLSNRNGHFVAVDISGIDDTVFADTLFGHKKGAFTGVPEARRGLIEQASGGTLFLDEIGDLSPVSQLKLLRLIQEREYLPLGSDMLKKSDARIIVATNRDINKLLQSDAFRKDLYYRLRTHHIHLPPLRERMDDLPLLAAHFLEEASKELGKKKPAIPAQLNTLLGTYSFPGNIRELRAMVFDALSSHRAGTLSLQMFKIAMGGEVPPGNDNGELLAASEAAAFSFHEKLPTLREAEQLLIERAMNRAGGNQSVAARLLGITRQALNRRLNRAAKK
jgi:DNA-binding NtrC family response regulator